MKLTVSDREEEANVIEIRPIVLREKSLKASVFRDQSLGSVLRDRLMALKRRLSTG